jgi:hypothetical protein
VIPFEGLTLKKPLALRAMKIFKFPGLSSKLAVAESLKPGVSKIRF